MAEYVNIRTVRRGRSRGVATYAAAYRADESIVDERTGNLYKYVQDPAAGDYAFTGTVFLDHTNEADSLAVFARSRSQPDRGIRTGMSPSQKVTPLEHYILSVKLRRDKVGSFDEYPFSLPVVRHLDTLELHPVVTFLVGKNGNGKSTLMEAIAVAWGFNPEGGIKNFRFGTRASHSVLHEYLRPVTASGIQHRHPGHSGSRGDQEAVTGGRCCRPARPCSPGGAMLRRPDSRLECPLCGRARPGAAVRLKRLCHPSQGPKK